MGTVLRDTLYETDLISIVAQMEAYVTTKKLDLSIRSSHVQFVYLCGMTEEKQNAINHKWAP